MECVEISSDRRRLRLIWVTGVGSLTTCFYLEVYKYGRDGETLKAAVSDSHRSSGGLSALHLLSTGKYVTISRHSRAAFLGNPVHTDC